MSNGSKFKIGDAVRVAHEWEMCGKDLKQAIYAAVSNGPATWPELFEFCSEAEYSEETVKRAIRKGVSFGCLFKAGGQRTRIEPTVAMTELGRIWFEEWTTNSEDLPNDDS